jgi:hypothetical protein
MDLEATALIKAIRDLYGGLERMKHSNALCVKLAEICFSICYAVADSKATSSQIRRATTEIEGLRGLVKTWEGKSLAWWYLFRADVNARLTGAIEVLKEICVNFIPRRGYFVFPTRGLLPYIYDGKSSDPMVDYATFDFGAPFSPDIKDNWQSNVPAIVTEMDMVAKAINLYDELTHLLYYYDNFYKVSNKRMEDYRTQAVLPSAIGVLGDRKSAEEKNVENLKRLYPLDTVDIYTRRLKKTTEQIALAKKKLASEFPKIHGDIKFLKERWADRKAYLIDTISELGALDSDRKLARLRDSLQNAKIEESTSSKNEAHDVLLRSPSISTEGAGNFLRISILEGSNRSIVESAIGVLAPYLKKWDEKKDALSQGLRQIGYEPRGTEKSRSERTVVSSDERSDSAIERFNLCQTELENQRRNLVDLQKQVERATASDTAMRKRVADLANVEDELRRCQTENKLHLAKTELYLSYTKFIGLYVTGTFIGAGPDEDSDNEDDLKNTVGDQKFSSYYWWMEQVQRVNKTLPPLIERVDQLCGVSERKKFMRVILDNTFAASQSPHPYENGSVFQKYVQAYDEISKMDINR